MTQKIEISTSTIFRFILIILGLVFIFLIRDVLLMVFVALIISAAIDAPVDRLAKRRLPRALGAAIIYLIIAGLLSSFVYWAFPVLADQLQSLAIMLPDYLNKSIADISIFDEKIGGDNAQKVLSNLSSQLYGATKNIFGTAANIFGGFFSLIVIMVVSFYLVVQDKSLKTFLSDVLPAEHRFYIISLTERIQFKLGRWLRGQLLVMLAVGFLIFLGLKLLGVKMALMLAVLAGILEIVPYFGPFTAGAIAVSLAFVQSPILGFLVLILFVVIHQIEGYVLIPQVMKRVVGLNPLAVILSMAIGAKLFGVLGMAVAVPIAATISVFLGDIFSRDKDKEKTEELLSS